VGGAAMGEPSMKRLEKAHAKEKNGPHRGSEGPRWEKKEDRT
jgi:hypothetical protein